MMASLQLTVLVLYWFFSQQSLVYAQAIEKDVTSTVAETRQQEQNVDSDNVDYSALQTKQAANAANDKIKCPGKTVDKRNGPLYVVFQLPESEEGTAITYEAGRVYRHFEGECYVLSWSDHSFVCDSDIGEFVQTGGSWPVALDLPEGCVNGGGETENTAQENFVVSNNMPLSCPAAEFDVHNGPIHVRFSLPEGLDPTSNILYTSGNAGRKTSDANACYQIVWSDLEFVCDPDTFQWTRLSGLWTTEAPEDCNAWENNFPMISNGNQPYLEVVDKTQSEPPTAPSVSTIRPILVDYPTLQPTGPGTSANVVSDETGIPTVGPTAAPIAINATLKPTVPAAASTTTSPTPGSTTTTVAPATTEPTSSSPVQVLTQVEVDASANSTQSPTQVSIQSNPNVTTGASTESYCGCQSCTQSIWEALAESFTCGQRISFLIDGGSSLADACRQVAGNEHPSVCGPCACDGVEEPVPPSSTIAPLPSTNQDLPEEATAGNASTPEIPVANMTLGFSDEGSASQTDAESASGSLTPATSGPSSQGTLVLSTDGESPSNLRPVSAAYAVWQRSSQLIMLLIWYLV